MIMWIAASLILAVVVAWMVLTPLLVEGSLVSVTNEVDDNTSLADAKERGLRALKDLDLDYAMGKLSKEDYEQAKSALTLEVSQILEKVKAAGHK